MVRLGRKIGNAPPPIYPGWEYIEGGVNWCEGHYAMDEYGFPYVWIPVDEDTELEGIPDSRVKEIRKDGGFPFPANPASKGENGLLQFVEGNDIFPIHSISPDNAQIELAKLDTKTVGYRSFFKAEIICVCKWLEENGYSMEDGTNWGNYRNTPNREYGLSPIGSRKEARTKIGINDFTGTLWWPSKPESKRTLVDVFNGSYRNDGDCCPAMRHVSISSCIELNIVGVWGVPYRK